MVLHISQGNMLAFAEEATGGVGAGVVGASEIHWRHSLQLDRQHFDPHPLAEPPDGSERAPIPHRFTP